MGVEDLKKPLTGIGGEMTRKVDIKIKALEAGR